MSSRDMHPSRDRSPTVGTGSEIVVRSGSAVVLAAVAVLLTVSGVWPFALLLCVGGIIAAWEWGRLVRGEGFGLATACHAVVLVAVVALAAAERVDLALLAFVVGLLAVGALRWSRADVTWSLFGVVYLVVPCVALMTMRGDPQSGWVAVLFLFTVVWCADSSAYVFGRLIGGPKLAPGISPGKTWAGFAGGICVPALLGLAWALWLGNTSWIALALLAVGLSLAAQLGDLAESATKRTFRVKDASHLIPGHGGLLDRIDGLLFAAVVAGSIVALRQTDGTSPGGGLLVWP